MKFEDDSHNHDNRMFVTMFSLYTCIKELITTNIAFNFSLVIGCRDVVGVVDAPELTHQAIWHLVTGW